jgi:hypothetical protein
MSSRKHRYRTPKLLVCALVASASLAATTPAAAMVTRAGDSTVTLERSATPALGGATDAYRAYMASIRDGARAATASYAATRVKKIPAFARKYGLRCSACHTVWPELNSFGQQFRDNGYQLQNERDTPISQNNAYFPMTIRVTPQFHAERATKQLVDATPGDATSGQAERTLTSHGFDLSGIDIWTAGTLWKNVSFVVLLSGDNLGSFGFEAMHLRFDNLGNSPWLNLKVGKFELDNLISEKRFLFLSGNGGSYQSYHFSAPGSSVDFGIGDNQIGAELSGHSLNSYTRYSAALLTSSDGDPSSENFSSYDANLNFSQAFDGGKLGVERVGAFAYLGERPTSFQTSGGEEIPGTGSNRKMFYRAGVAGDFFLHKLEFLPFYLHGNDNAYLATSTQNNEPLIAGARDASWNAGFLETHYYINQQFVLTQRVEAIRMSQQALSDIPSTLGNVDAYSFGTRWYPFMFSRAGLAVHGEYSLVKTVSPGQLPSEGSTINIWSSSLLFALDFDF